jgi:hypothetical protein
VSGTRARDGSVAGISPHLTYRLALTGIQPMTWNCSSWATGEVLTWMNFSASSRLLYSWRR